MGSFVFNNKNHLFLKKKVDKQFELINNWNHVISENSKLGGFHFRPNSPRPLCQLVTPRGIDIFQDIFFLNNRTDPDKANDLTRKIFEPLFMAFFDEN